MALLPVSPTRMELSRLKKQLQMSERGYKLLKDKQDELMRQFIGIIRETQALRASVEQSFRAIRKDALLAKAPFSEREIAENNLSVRRDISLTMKPQNRMGVIVPVMEFKEDAPLPSIALSPALGEARVRMEALMPMLLELSQLEKHSVILSAEIEKTRRRVNALEYMTIPQLKETIRFIRMRLEDAERDRITRLIKMQDFETASVR